MDRVNVLRRKAEEVDGGIDKIEKDGKKLEGEDVYIWKVGKMDRGKRKGDGTAKIGK